MIAPVSTHTAADGRTYSLHGTTITYPGGRRQPVYRFARRAAVETTLAALPAGYRVAESPVTRRPYLRRA